MFSALPEDAKVTVSFIEVYNDAVHDLLRDGDDPKKLQIRTHNDVNAVVGATESRVRTAEEALRFLEAG